MTFRAPGRPAQLIAARQSGLPCQYRYGPDEPVIGCRFTGPGEFRASYKPEWPVRPGS
jgi:hypothetical protein